MNGRTSQIITATGTMIVEDHARKNRTIKATATVVVKAKDEAKRVAKGAMIATRG